MSCKGLVPAVPGTCRARQQSDLGRPGHGTILTRVLTDCQGIPNKNTSSMCIGMLQRPAGSIVQIPCPTKRGPA